MKKVITLLLVLIVGCSCVACDLGSNEENKGNGSQSILSVAVINSGLGLAYAEEIKKDFEALYADTSFEEGKKGVFVDLQPGLDEYSTVKGTLQATIQNLETTAYILDRVDYHYFVQNNKLVDITDTVNEKVYDEDGELAIISGKEPTLSILDLMPESYQYFYSYKTNGKYYGVPYRVSVGGLIYDADLFNERELFFKADGTIGATYEDIENGNCSTGPDGVLGTSDDGLANTMSDFGRLLVEMRLAGITPFSFSGAYKYTRTEMFTAIQANYEGYDDFMLNYTLNGTDSDPNIGEINDTNYTKLLDQDGRKAAIRFFQEIAKTSDNWVKNSDTSLDQKQAQDAYVNANPNKPVAFLIDGGWWESEARETFDIVETQDPNRGYGKRNYRLYAYPDMIGEEGVADQTNNERVIFGKTSPEGCAIMLSKESKAKNKEVQERLGKLLIQFMNSREQVLKFTKNTGGCLRPVINKKPYTEEELSALTHYGQSIYTYIAEGAKVGYAVPQCTSRIEAYASFGSSDGGWDFWAEVAGGLGTNCCIDAFLKWKTTYGELASVTAMHDCMKQSILRTFAGPKKN